MEHEITVVMLDIDDTLLDFAACSREAMEQAYGDLGIALTESMFVTFQQVNHKLWQELEQGKLTKERLFQIRWNEVFKAQGLREDGEAFEAGFQAYLTESALPISGARELLRYLSEKYTVCVVSNAPYERQIKRLSKAGMIEFIDHAFISGQIGHSKPSRAFFDHCFSKLSGKAPEETMVIGDSLTADIVGGKDYGTKTIWLNRNGKICPASIEPDYTVTALQAIHTIL